MLQLMRQCHLADTTPVNKVKIGGNTDSENRQNALSQSLMITASRKRRCREKNHVQVCVWNRQRLLMMFGASVVKTNDNIVFRGYLYSY